jgi:hypothetical protein
MHRVESEPTIPVFQRAKTLDSSAAVVGTTIKLLGIIRILKGHLYQYYTILYVCTC